MTVAARIVQAVADEIRTRPVVVALGGGADSATAAWACVEGGLATRAVFVNHHLPSSAYLGRSAAALCEQLGLDLTVRDGAVADGPDLERRARDARRTALLDDLRGGECLLLAHTGTDQAETVLMNLSRGAGAVGLSAMDVSTGRIVRPLLGFARADTRDVAESRGLPFVDDPANADPRFTRNRMRAEVLPVLEDIRSGSTAALGRSATLLGRDDRVIRSLATEVPVRSDGGAVLVPLPVLAVVGKAVAHRALDDACRNRGQSSITSRDLERVFDIVDGRADRAQLSGSRFADREGPYVAVWGTEPTVPDPMPLVVPGTVAFGDHRLTIALEARDPLALRIDRGVMAGAVTVRAVENGDRIAIRDGSKLVNDALAEEGVPRRLRLAWPVVVAGANIAAVPAVRVAAWARPTDAEALTLTDERHTW